MEFVGGLFVCCCWFVWGFLFGWFLIPKWPLRLHILYMQVKLGTKNQGAQKLQVYLETQPHAFETLQVFTQSDEILL